MIWEGKGFSFDCSSRTLLMGILNVTPDSFSDGGRFLDPETAVEHGLRMVEEGADVLDIGGESTRPGSEPVSVQEEIDRVCPIIESLAPQTDVPISIDTYKAEVAQAACRVGAKIVNDISGLHFDPKIVNVVLKYGAGLVLMHIKGTPRDMQTDPTYENLFSEIILYLKEGMDRAVEAGVLRSSIVLDPGIGFGKNLEHNLALIGNLERLTIVRRPILMGVSRKSFIGKLTDAKVDDRLPGTAAAVAACILNGAGIMRVHDVKEMVQVARITDAIVKSVQG